MKICTMHMYAYYFTMSGAEADYTKMRFIPQKINMNCHEMVSKNTHMHYVVQSAVVG